MYSHMNHTMIHALEAARREAVRRATQRPARAAPVPSAVLRLAIGRMLVRVGNRLAPDGVSAAPVADTPC